MADRTAEYYLARIEQLYNQSGIVGVNLGGAGEVPGYVNVNNCIDGRNPAAIPKLINDTAENIADHFALDSVDHIVANNIVAGTMDWAAVAIGMFRILRSGGIVSLAEFGGGYDKGQGIKRALEAAKFHDIVIIYKTLVVAEK